MPWLGFDTRSNGMYPSLRSRVGNNVNVILRSLCARADASFACVRISSVGLDLISFKIVKCFRVVVTANLKSNTL